MPTQNVNLTPELELFVKSQVASGYFNNASEVHRAALSALARDEEERELRLEALRSAIQEGRDDLEAGRCVSISSKKEHRAYFAKLREEAVKRVER